MSKCLFCGNTDLGIELKGHRGLRQAVCDKCGARGPLMLNGMNAVMESLSSIPGYIRLAPDEIVVKRATAEHAARLSECYHCDDPDCPCGECEADLEAALARGK